MQDRTGEQPETSARGFIASHPVIAALFVACTLAGAVAGAVYLPGEWSLARRLAAGAFAGAGSALVVSATRLIG
jgi:hypothetical protein